MLSVLVFLAAMPAVAAELNLGRLISTLEQRYNRPTTVQLLFQQTYTSPGKPPRSESGVLYMRKPRRMRWEYFSPAGKLFVADGRHVYFYTPSTNRVEKMVMKESDDVRVPLAFLIGRLDFRRDFRELRGRTEGQNVLITALPKSDKAPFTDVDFVVNSNSEIIGLAVRNQDLSVTEFRFSEERLDPPVSDNLFRFKTPPGAELVEVTESEEGVED